MLPPPGIRPESARREGAATLGQARPVSCPARSDDSESPTAPARSAGRSARADVLVPTSCLADHVYSQVRPKRLRHHHAAVGLLIVLDDRHPGAANRQAAAIQRVRVFRFLSALETDS